MTNEEAASNGLILNMLLSVKQGANQFPNVMFLRTQSWAAVQQVPAGDVYGRDLFQLVGQESYETAQHNIKSTSLADLTDDAAVMTRSVEALSAGVDGIATPWDGSIHPPAATLAKWVNAIRNNG